MCFPRYQQSWRKTIPFWAALFIHFRDHSQLLLGDLLKQLADLYTAIQPINQATAELIKGESYKEDTPSLSLSLSSLLFPASSFLLSVVVMVVVLLY